MLKVLEQLLHKIKANRRREMVVHTPRKGGRAPIWGYDFDATTNHRCKNWDKCGAWRRRSHVGYKRASVIRFVPTSTPPRANLAEDCPRRVINTMTVLLKNLFTVHFQFDLLKLETNNTRDDKLKHAWIIVR